jgi:hypothetical protein
LICKNRFRGVDGSFFFTEGGNLDIKQGVFLVAVRFEDHASGVNGKSELRMFGQKFQSTAETTERDLVVEIEGIGPYLLHFQLPAYDRLFPLVSHFKALGDRIELHPQTW